MKSYRNRRSGRVERGVLACSSAWSERSTLNRDTVSISLTEKIVALRKSVAAGGQQLMGPTVHIGSESVNALTMMLDTIDLLAELAQQCASHSHPNTGTPTSASAFTQTATKAGQTRSRYQSLILEIFYR